MHTACRELEIKTMLLFACSGPQAMQAIQDNLLYANSQAMIVGALAVLSVVVWLIHGHFKGLAVITALLALLHPARCLF